MAYMYAPLYSASRALIIGIDKYAHISPLSFAVSDAQGVATSLLQHGFPFEDITLLLNEEATSEAIFKRYMQYAQDYCGANDRLVVFFAGHGHTVCSSRGEVGFLVPHDGDPSDLSTLLRWDDFTRNADLIRAKHVLFLMDACYGGLAVTRSAPPGSLRFVRDMMIRPTRLVLTAGKANEQVADSGGPLPNHSIFTGHLLSALEGAAADNAGNLTANGIIAYVYSAVSRDDDSQQTPHYGYLQGDGDMIFKPTDFADDLEASHPSDHRLVSIPITAPNTTDGSLSVLSALKELLSEDRFRIKLFDYMVQETRLALAATADDYFPVQGIVEKEGFLQRLTKYETAMSSLIPQQLLLGRWSTPEQKEAATLPARRLSERLGAVAGSSWLIESRWYPMLLLVYAAGLGAVAGSNYSAFVDLLHSPTPRDYSRKPAVLVISVIDSTGEFHEAFKWIPGRERNVVARSEHIFSVLQPFADDTLYVGSQYQDIFDQVELLISLEYMHLAYPSGGLHWSPIGRFAWRGRDYGTPPLDKLKGEAERQGPDWAPLKAGFFGKSKERFNELVSELEARVSRVSWM